MTNIMLATEENLHKGLSEIDEQYNNLDISGTSVKELKALEETIKEELTLRSAGVDYLHCHYRHQNGNCAAIGGFCTSNCSGEAFKFCQKYRKEYIEVTHKSK